MKTMLLIAPVLLVAFYLLQTTFTAVQAHLQVLSATIK